MSNRYNHPINEQRKIYTRIHLLRQYAERLEIAYAELRWNQSIVASAIAGHKDSIDERLNAENLINFYVKEITICLEGIRKNVHNLPAPDYTNVQVS